MPDIPLNDWVELACRLDGNVNVRKVSPRACPVVPEVPAKKEGR